MEDLGYYNGIYGRMDEMTVPMNDRVHFFGDGVYDATCSINKVIYLLEEHLERFFRNLALLRIPAPCTKLELERELNCMVEKVDGDALFVYWQATRGTAPRNHAFPEGRLNLWITITPMTFRDLEQRVALTSMEDTRYLHCNIKTLNLIPSVMAAEKAAEEDCFETVFHRGEIVTECAHSNVMILQGGRLLSHPNDRYILEGIAKRHLLMACKSIGIPVTEKAFTVEQLRQADEILVTSSSNFCLAANRFEGKMVGGKAPEVVEQLQQVVMREFQIYCGVEDKVAKEGVHGTFCDCSN